MEEEPASAFSRPLTAVPLARWERKQQQAEQQSKNLVYDRFITSHNSDLSLLPSTPNHHLALSQQSAYDSYLAQSLFGCEIDSKILKCQKKPPPSNVFQDSMRVLYTANKLSSGVKRTHRYISSAPERILDAPELVDDYYLNVLDWSSQNQLALALHSDLYLWNPENGGIDTLFNIPEDQYVCSVSWMKDGTHLAVGLSDHTVALWNIEYKKKLRTMPGHIARVSSLAWNNHILSSGSRDTNIINHDVRIAQHCVASLKSHTQEVCGLKWSLDGTQLASGANDNTCYIWDQNNEREPRYVFNDANAAVKALAWSPHDRHVLATGSGTNDGNIRMYDTQGGFLQTSLPTNSQVCSLLWNPYEREILSTHGFQQNQVSIWKIPSMVKVTDLYGHTSRVLYSALSADGTTVATAAADETIRFWKVFEPPKKEKKSKVEAEPPSSLRHTIR